jgi:hypothetical protein
MPNVPGGILIDLQAMLLRDLHDRGHGRRVPVEVHRHDRLGLGCDGRLDRGRIDVEAVQLDVGEDRGRAGERHGVGGRREAERRNDDLVAWADPAGEERHVQGRRARVEGDRVESVDEL